MYILCFEHRERGETKLNMVACDSFDIGGDLLRVNRHDGPPKYFFPFVELAVESVASVIEQRSGQ